MATLPANHYPLRKIVGEEYLREHGEGVWYDKLECGHRGDMADHTYKTVPKKFKRCLKCIPIRTPHKWHTQDVINWRVCDACGLIHVPDPVLGGKLFKPDGKTAIPDADFKAAMEICRKIT